MQCFTTTIHISSISMLDNKEYFVERAEALEQMLNEFDDKEKYSDALSRKLISWGNAFLDEMCLHGNDSIERIKELSKPYFDSLNYEILRDDLRSSLNDSNVFTIDDIPVIGHEFNNTWVWSKRVYERCFKACNEVSPIDGGRMKKNPKIHPVAHAFIQWKTPLFPSSYDGTGAIAPPLTETDLLIERVAFQRLGILANSYRMAKEDIEETDAALADADASQQQAMAIFMQAQARLQLERKILVDEKDALKKRYEENLRQLDEQATRNEVLAKAQIEQLKKDISDAKAISEAMAKDQKKRLEKLEEEERLAKETIQKEKEILQKNLLAKTKELEDKQTANERNYHTLVTQMQRNHAQAFSTLTTQMGNLSTEIGSLKESLVQQTQTSMMQEGMIIGLKAHSAGLASVLEAERRKKRGGSGCQLM